MEYTKTSWKIDPDSEINREILVANLGNIGYESFTETIEYIEAYIVSRDFSQEALSDLFPEDFTLFKSSYTYEIIPDKCTGCMVCKKGCPTNAIEGERKQIHFIHQNLCIKCGDCYSKCKFESIKIF